LNRHNQSGSDEGLITASFWFLNRHNQSGSDEAVLETECDKVFRKNQK
jgi:hypothetical protein